MEIVCVLFDVVVAEVVVVSVVSSEDPYCLQTLYTYTFLTNSITHTHTHMYGPVFCPFSISEEL